MALTPVELRICNMIRMGLSTKEIAQNRHIAPATSESPSREHTQEARPHRKNVNLVTYLQTFEASQPRMDERGR